MRELWPQIPSLKVLLRKQKAVKEPCRWSQFVIRFDASGKKCLYNTLTGQCLELDDSIILKESYDPEEIRSDPSLRFLMEAYHLVPRSKDEVSFYMEIYRIRRAFAGKRGYAHYIILPTWSCNARCIYCFEEGMPNTTMNDEIVEKTVSFLLSSRRPDETIRLKWFGGEPLLGERIIDRISSALTRHEVGFRAVMTTNGSLITEEIARKMTGPWHMESVKVSMDCAESEYIRRKNFPVYEDTYHRVMRNVNLLMQYGISVNIRCNLDEGNMDAVPEFLSDLENVIDKKEDLLVAFSPLHASAERPEGMSLIEYLYEARLLAKERGFRVNEYGSGAGFRANHCTADNPEGGIVIAPTGELFPCTFCEEGTSFGDVAHGITGQDILSGYMDVKEPMAKCRNCVFLPCCTPFDKCPVINYYCKENQMKYMLEMLSRRLARDVREE